jgi:ribosomal protein S4
MAKLFKSKFTLVKRYARFSNTCVYFKSNKRKKIRYGYKVYQKIFKRYRSKKTIRINVRKPRVSIKRKTSYGKALEIKEKFSYLVGGIHASKLQRYVQFSRAKARSPMHELLKKIESRLDVIIYRINIVQSPFFIKSLIKKGYVYVNGKKKTRPSYSVKKNSFVDVRLPPVIYKLLRRRFVEAYRRKLIFKPYNDYLEISYKLFRAVLHSDPTEKTVFYPFDFKIYYFFRLYPR